MNRIAVAQELVRLARELSADSGDVNYSFNTGDYFSSTPANPMNMEKQKKAEQILGDALGEVWWELNAVVQKELSKQKYRRMAEQAGLVIGHF